MENTISNRKCKECIWYDAACLCTEPERNRINKEKRWDYYRNFRRMSEPACKRFKEKENNMDKDYIITYLDMATDKVSQKKFHTLLGLSNWMEEREVTITNIEQIKEDNMDIKKAIKECEDIIAEAGWTSDAVEEELDNTVDTTDDPKRSKNKYGIGEILYLPVRVVTIRESSNKEYILYETRTVDDNKLITIREDKLVDGIKEV